MNVNAATVTLAAPSSVKAVSSSYDSVTVSWSGVAGAVGYRVYRAASSKGSYSYITTVAAKSYKDTGLKTGTTYYYKVRAYKYLRSSKVYGKYSSVVQVIPVLSKPASISAVTSLADRITVSWSKVAGASGYRVYRATSSTGTFSYLTSTTGISYINTGLDSGTAYYYKVRAYRTVGGNKVYSKYTSVVNAVTGLPEPVSISAVSSSYNSITVNWSEVTGTGSYRIYRAESDSGVFTYLASTTEESYEDTGLSTGITYYYKVRAYKAVGSSKIYGKYTSVVNAKPILPVPAKINTEAVTYNSITVTWNSSEGSNGYQLYVAASSSGPYTKLTTTTQTNYTDTGLKPDTTYYYKIRACRSVGSSYVYSDYTPVKSSKTPEAHAEAVNLNKSEYTLALGKSVTLIATVTPDCAVDLSVTWDTSDDTVAIVDKNGKVTPISAGTATITATTVDGGLTASCEITVSNTKIKGIDVSKWQGTINWASVKSAGIKFAMIRSSYGSSSVDPKFESNYEAAKSNGISLGVYHYSYATTVAKAVTEVNFLISKLDGKQFEYPICVDVEDSSMSNLDMDTLTDIVMTYITYLTDAGYYPMVYANKTWFTSKLDDSRLTDTDHWLAEWKSSYTYTGAVGIWQYSSAGSVSGIAGKVDLDYSYIDYKVKMKYLHLNGF